MNISEYIQQMASRPSWRLSDAEWKSLGALLTESTRGDKPQRRRPRHVNDRDIAEVCLFRHFHSLAPVYSSFGWNSLPAEFKVAPSTANDRYRNWVRSGDWEKFWQKFLRLRQGGPPKRLVVGSPVIPILAELERAYSFFNARLFMSNLPCNVAICLDSSIASRCLGYFSGSRWRLGEETLHHISLSTAAIGRGAEFALEVLLHEMVHFWNHVRGLKDVSGRNQYHNQHFRDAALLFGLECPRFSNQRGYSATRLSARGTAMVRAFRPDEAAFNWKVDVFRRVQIGNG